MTGRDPLAEWTLVHEHPYEHGYMRGGNDRLDALRPLIAAADDIVAHCQRHYLDDAALVGDIATYLATRDHKGDTP